MHQAQPIDEASDKFQVAGLATGEAAPAAKPWCHDEAGVTAIEYGLLAALIAVSIIGAVSATGVNLNALYTVWSNAVIAAVQGAL